IEGDGRDVAWLIVEITRRVEPKRFVGEPVYIDIKRRIERLAGCHLVLTEGRFAEDEAYARNGERRAIALFVAAAATVCPASEVPPPGRRHAVVITVLVSLVLLSRGFVGVRGRDLRDPGPRHPAVGRKLHPEVVLEPVGVIGRVVVNGH